MPDEETTMDKLIKAQEKIDALEAHANDNQILANMFADPHIREVWEAKQRGEEIQVVKKGQADPTKKIVEDNTTPDFNDMDNAALTKHILEQTGKVVKEIIETTLEPVSTKISMVESHVQKTMQQDVHKQIEDAKKTHSDFEALLPTIKDLNTQNPGNTLSVEDLYILAKARNGVPSEKDTTTNSEKPTHDAARGGDGAEDKTPVLVPAGRRGFDQLLNSSLEKLDLSALG